MKKIKEFAWWYGWLKEKNPFLGLVILLFSLGLFCFSAYGVKQALAGDSLILLLMFIFTTVATVFLFGFFFFMGLSFRYTSDSRNWRLVIDKAWTFANKNPEAFYEIERWIRKTKVTKDPKELNEFMDKWKSRKQKRAELLRKLEHQLQKLKEIEDIMSGRKTEQIKEEIKKTKEKIRKI